VGEGAEVPHRLEHAELAGGQVGVGEGAVDARVERRRGARQLDVRVECVAFIGRAAVLGGHGLSRSVRRPRCGRPIPLDIERFDIKIYAGLVSVKR
jgi:hypothetical protein